MERGSEHNNRELIGNQSAAVRALAGAGIVIGALLSVLMVPPILSLLSPQVNSQAQATVPAPLVLDPKESVMVLVPRQQIFKGDRLVSLNFKFIRVPLTSPAAAAIRRADRLTGKYAGRDLSPNLPIFERDVRNTPELNEVVKSIPADYRAISVSVDATSGVEGWASPGAAVDVVLIASQDGVPTSNILAQNAEVLSANRRSVSTAKPGAAVPTSITLLARAEEAARIGLASKVGKIVLHLRGWKDSRMGQQQELTLEDVKGARTSRAPRAILNSNELGRPSL